MPRALELFNTRRSRVGRGNPEIELDLPPDRSFPHQRHNRRGPNSMNGNDNDVVPRVRRDLNGCYPTRPSPLARNPSFRSSHPEQGTVQLNEGSHQFSSSNIINLESFGGIGSRQISSGNDRLPGAVLRARERLIERLRGVSLSRNRSSSGSSRNDLSIGDEFRLFDAGGDWETELFGEWSTGISLLTVSQPGHLIGPPQARKQSPGLSQEALDHLQMEVFSNANCNDKAEMSIPSRDCSICLESFVEGNKLFCLPCRHRFHSDCLVPWLQTCGDCPYCRRGIVVTNPAEDK